MIVMKTLIQRFKIKIYPLQLSRGFFIGLTQINSIDVHQISVTFTLFFGYFLNLRTYNDYFIIVKVLLKQYFKNKYIKLKR